MSDDPDAKKRLYAEGAPILMTLLDRKRSEVGAVITRLLRQAKDDAAMVLAIIKDAGRVNPVSPMPWLVAAIGSRRDNPRAAPPVAEDDLGIVAWLARQATTPGMIDNVEYECINGVAVVLVIDRIIEAVMSAGKTFTDRVNWDGLVPLLNDNMLDDPDVWRPAVKRVAAGVSGPIHSVAVFTAAIRAANSGMEAVNGSLRRT